ncbi:hypothetical protein BDV95DRAFT_627232 [Massariosphaeria phaeospora]|uniref:Uncharacterized protein n=1 Tax=Massariosphaeria phaeospora TaxID=100035 RepID=A0A7C8IEY7_9PLEO|nr:hypothetical protein BDV95DRAFT_627232 [Massariosphaeria phaeospora]
MLYNVLPAVMQSRMPTLPSFRQSISDFRGRAFCSDSPNTDTETITAESPPPEYSSRASSMRPSRDSAESTDTEDIGSQENTFAKPQSSNNLPSSCALSETQTGINWRYARQGINLLTQAYHESLTIATVNDNSVVLPRQLHLHGTVYLLQSLPADLSPQEVMSLRTALPRSIFHHSNNKTDPSTSAMIQNSSTLPAASKAEVHSRDASILHRTIATIVFEIFVLTQFLLPYIKLFIGHVSRIEREHKVTHRLVNMGITTVDGLGRRSLQLSQTVCQMNDGKVGRAINDLTIWWVRGLTGGIQQGMTDGVVMLGNERRTLEKLD